MSDAVERLQAAFGEAGMPLPNALPVPPEKGAAEKAVAAAGPARATLAAAARATAGR